MSMTVFELLNDYSVLIPSLQRDYVYGRDDSHSKAVREHFVRSLVACSEGNNEMNLDVVYGVIRNGSILVPIDGQQRLTTVWLAAIYAIINITQDETRQRKLFSKMSRFSYESRPLASAFCRWLTSGSVIDDFGSSLAQAEKNWGYDPTVHSMVTILRLLHKTCVRVDRLLSALEGSAIHFEFSEVQGNDADLYQKINARGITLTQWENFKGVFSNHLIDPLLRCQFNSQIETLSDKYFELFNSVPDNAFFAIFCRVADYILRTDKDNQYTPQAEVNLAAVAQGRDAQGKGRYVPIEEFHLERVAQRMAIPMLRMLKWTLEDGQNSVLRYWGTLSDVKNVLFTPQSDNDRDFTLFLFEYFLNQENADALSQNSGRNLRFVANILDNVDRDATMQIGAPNYRPDNQFNRIRFFQTMLLMHGGDLYEKCHNAMDGFSPQKAMQYNEELTKASIYQNGTPEQIELLQECEKYMHGRVRIALFNSNGEEWNSISPIETQMQRLSALKRHLDTWRQAAPDQRNELLRQVIACESWRLKDQILLSLADESLKDILSNRNDVQLQRTYLDGNADAPWTRDAAWERDWRRAVFTLQDWEERRIRWHGDTGTLFLYARGYTNIPNAMPIADWRIDIEDAVRNGAFENIGNIDSVCSNAGGTRYFPCVMRDVVGDNDVKVYLWKDRIEVRWFNYDGNTSRSEWIPIEDQNNVEDLATRIQNTVTTMCNER